MVAVAAVVVSVVVLVVVVAGVVDGGIQHPSIGQSVSVELWTPSEAGVEQRDLSTGSARQIWWVFVSEGTI